MNKKDFIKVFENAIESHAAYIGVENKKKGSSRPEIIINPAENFAEKLKYYKTAYDEEMMLVSEKGKKGIQITAAVRGDSFADIEFQLIGERKDWKKTISNAIDKVVEREMEKSKYMTQETRESLETLFESLKEQFYKNRYSFKQQKFIIENEKLYEELFETCMNGSDEEFREKFIHLSKELNRHA